MIPTELMFPAGGAPRLPALLDDEHHRERFAVWCLAVLGARIEWAATPPREGSLARVIGMVHASPSIAAMVAGLAATYYSAPRIVRVAELGEVPSCG